MKKMVHELALVSILALAPSAWSQSAAGAWAGVTSGAGGLAPRPMTVVLEDDSTGTMEVGAVRALIDLKIEGSAVSFGFRPLILGQPANFLFRYRGQFDAEKMTLYAAMDREDGAELEYSEEPLVLTRQ
jgi:hypothetical protein